MPFREFEAMVFVENERELTEKLSELGAILIRQIIQKDTYYDLNFHLTKRDELFRIRINESIDNNKFLNGELSWKSGRKGENYEVREDISVPLPTLKSVQDLEQILSRLGFRKLAWLRKYRDRWRLDDIDFEFDKEIDAQAIHRPKRNIGSYLQATIETELEYTSDEMEKLLWNALELLGFNRSDFLWESYIELYLLQLNDSETIHFIKKREI